MYHSMTKSPGFIYEQIIIRPLDGTAWSPTLGSTSKGHSSWPNGNMHGQQPLVMYSVLESKDDDITNTPSFHTALGCFYYWAFVPTFKALEACHVPQEETILLLDMIRHQREQHSKFIDEENLPWDSEEV